MNKSVQEYLQRLNSRRFTSNLQRTLFRLLTAKGDGWVTLRSLRVSSAASRVRDLRTQEYGSFRIECRTARELGRDGDHRAFLYRVVPSSVTVQRLREIFE